MSHKVLMSRLRTTHLTVPCDALHAHKVYHPLETILSADWDLQQSPLQCNVYVSTYEHVGGWQHGFATKVSQLCSCKIVQLCPEYTEHASVCANVCMYLLGGVKVHIHVRAVFMY